MLPNILSLYVRPTISFSLDIQFVANFCISFIKIVLWEFSKISIRISGNRHLRAQKLEEMKTLEGLEYPPKRDKIRFQYFKILECCNFFASINGDNHEAITLVTFPSRDSDEFSPPEQIAANFSKMNFWRTICSFFSKCNALLDPSIYLVKNRQQYLAKRKAVAFM